MGAAIVELSGLGEAIERVVSVAQLLKQQDLVGIKRMFTAS